MCTFLSKLLSLERLCGARSDRWMTVFISRWTTISGRAWQVISLLYVQEVWAGFRLHEGAKSIAEDDRCWPEMLRVHYRDGGKKLSLFTLKYWVRKLVQPLWIWLRRKRIKG